MTENNFAPCFSALLVRCAYCFIVPLRLLLYCFAMRRETIQQFNNSTIQQMKTSLLLTIFLISILGSPNTKADAPNVSKQTTRKQIRQKRRQLRKQERQQKRQKRRVKRMHKFLNSRLGKWMIKRALRRAEKRRKYRNKRLTNGSKRLTIDDGNNGWIIGPIVFFVVGLGVVGLLLALGVPLVIAIILVLLGAFLATYLLVWRPLWRRRKGKIN